MKTHTTNCYNTLIEVADDSPVVKGTVPPVNGELLSVANIQFDLISKHPYEYTSDDVVFLTFVYKNDIREYEMEKARIRFFEKGQACMRCSPLCKRYGWGIHHNENAKIALVGIDSVNYQQLLDDSGVAKVKAMRTSRKK